MNNLSINPQQAFTGRYIVKINMSKTGRKLFDRDLMLGNWLKQAQNSSELVNKIRNDKANPLVLDYIIPDKFDSHFEHCMQFVGQKFKKIG